MSQEAPYPQIEYVEFQFTLDMSPNSKNVAKNSSLMFKIQKDPLKALNDLKNGGFSDNYINYQNERGWTILHYLCRNARNIPHAHDLIEFLLNHPITDVNIPQRKKWSPLLMTTFYSNSTSTEITVEMLLKHPNINVNFQMIDGYTALMGAAKNSNNTSTEKTVEMLLKHPNINVNIQNKNGDTALMLAYDNENVIKMLLQHPKININIKSNNNDICFIRLCENIHNSRSIINKKTVISNILTIFQQHPDFDNTEILKQLLFLRFT